MLNKDWSPEETLAAWIKTADFLLIQPLVDDLKKLLMDKLSPQSCVLWWKDSVDQRETSGLAFATFSTGYHLSISTASAAAHYSNLPTHHSPPDVSLRAPTRVVGLQRQPPSTPAPLPTSLLRPSPLVLVRALQEECEVRSLQFPRPRRIYTRKILPSVTRLRAQTPRILQVQFYLTIKGK